MPSRLRLTVFLTTFGSAALALLFGAVIAEDPLSDQHFTRLLIGMGLGLGGATQCDQRRSRGQAGEAGGFHRRFSKL